MKVYMVRHGEPVYKPCTERKFIGHGRDLAPLSIKGTEQAIKIARDERLRECELILSSPYTRALQTAAIISKETGKDIKVEMDLHEWIPDKTFQYGSYEELKTLIGDFRMCRGECRTEECKKWETFHEIQNRVIKVLDKYYATHNKIIMVCHGMVMCTLNCQREIRHGEIIEIDYHPDMPLPTWDTISI